MSPIDMSLLPATAAVGAQGALEIGGVDVRELAETFGTPLFVYDEADLRERFREAVAVFGDGVAYATKAFLCRALARIAHEEGMSLDVSTGGEYATCRAAGVPSSRLVLHGNGKTAGELETAVAEGVQWVVIDNFDELDRLCELTERLGRRVPVMIRVNPGVAVHTHRYVATGNRQSKFGLPMWTGDAEAALQRIQAHPRLELKGIHIHVGSQVFGLDTFISGLDAVKDFVRRTDPEVFVAGGGLGVRYLNADTAPSLKEWGEAVIAHCAAWGTRARVLAEPGRSMVASAAITVYRVSSLARKGDRTYAMTDGGMSDNPRPQLYGSDYEALLVRDPRAERDLPVTVVGRNCEQTDTLVANGALPAGTRVGDIIATPVTGAYGYSMASNYNMLTKPAVVFASHGEARLVLRRETLEDLLLVDVG